METHGRPSGGSERDIGTGSPHLADYWNVISRRIWLVLLIFGVTTASAIWAVSRQRMYYQASVSLQVTDPLHRTRSLTPGTRVSGMDLFIDPIQSEIEVLQASPIALAVIDSLGLRLTVPEEGVARSDLMRDIEVADDAPSTTLELRYDSDGNRATLLSSAVEALGSAATGTVLEGGGVRFILQPPPSEARSYGLELVRAEVVVDEVRNNISATPRENTNIIDVTFTHPDPILAPRILNQASQALRRYGARRVSVAASQDVAFIEEQLDSAQRQLSQSLDAIQEFKETRAFTDLSLQEQNLVNEIQAVTEEIDALERQRSTLAELERRMNRSPLGEVDLVSLLADLSEGENRQIRDLVNRIQDRQEELQDLLTTQRVTRDHPRAQAMLSQMASIRTELGEAIRANLRAIEGRIESQNEELAGLRREQQRFPALENRLQTLQLQQNLDEGTYEFLLSQLYQARITEAAAAPYVDIVDPALEARPIQPRGQMNVVLGALLGLILGIGTAFFLEYLDRTIRTSSDIEALLGIPVLGLVPRLRRVDGREEEEGGSVPLVVALDPLDPAAEAYRNLRMNLMFMSTADDPVRTILVTSAGPAEGKSTTALNLAVMLAQQSKKILLIDADLRRPALHRALDLLREPGLTDLLVGSATPKEAVRPNVLPNLDILPSGPFPPNPSELLDSKAMQRLIRELEDDYDQIVIDSPPMLAVTDTSVLSAQADGVLLVMRSGETEQRAGERSVDQLRRLDVRIFGAVLNEVSTSAAEDSYYLQYYYAYEPDTPKEAGKPAVAGVRDRSES